jgi:hypothetical protein
MTETTSFRLFLKSRPICYWTPCSTQVCVYLFQSVFAHDSEAVALMESNESHESSETFPELLYALTTARICPCHLLQKSA